MAPFNLSGILKFSLNSSTKFIINSALAVSPSELELKKNTVLASKSPVLQPANVPVGVECTSWDYWNAHPRSVKILQRYQNTFWYLTSNRNHRDIEVPIAINRKCHIIPAIRFDICMFKGLNSTSQDIGRFELNCKINQRYLFNFIIVIFIQLESNKLIPIQSNYYKYCPIDYGRTMFMKFKVTVMRSPLYYEQFSFINTTSQKEKVYYLLLSCEELVQSL
ncbi:Hypothetical_protein [Hexamita inflata]|uniref:Hypothetical_protein n=1 Tax=Hexamita inflata TaxID=28002 RepID=A0ABP1KJ60_9EUKA